MGTATGRAAALCLVAFGGLAVLAPAPARAAGPFEGDFVGADGERLALRQEGERVTGSLLQGEARAPVAGAVQGGVLRATARLLGQEVGFTARPVARGLEVLLEGDDEPALFERRGGAAAAPAAAPAAPGGEKPGPRAPAEVAAAGGAGSTGGRLHRVAHQGWSVQLPAGWDGEERDGMLVLGSRTEAGLLLVQATGQRDPEGLRAGLGEDLAEVGLAGPVPALQPARLPGGRGLQAEFPVTARDGAALRLRAVAVVGERGTVAILGATTAEKMGLLRQRVDEMARSVRLFAPEVTPGQQFVAGEWWSYTGAGAGATGGTEAALAFCPDGRFFDSSESSYGGGAGTAGAWGVASQRGGGGGARWTASGTPEAGRVTVTRADGSTAEMAWKARPDGGVYFDGRLYARTGERKYCR